MDSNSQQQNQKSSDQQFTEQQPKKSSKQVSKSKQKKAPKGKAAKKPKQKQKKQAKEAKQPKKKKASKSKDKIGNIQKDTQTVRQYLQKQNRPYSLINIFDNLHGSIKKPALQIILDNLATQQFLTCKKFGSNKVYFLNQSKFAINADQLENLGVELSKAREQSTNLQSKYKALIDEHRKLISLKTQKQMQQTIESLKTELIRLQKKKEKLLNGIDNKIDQQTVIKVEKQQQKIKKDLKKYRKIKKDAINTWCQILQKKPAEVADIIGVDI